MREMKIYRLLRERRGYLATAILSGLFILLVFPAIQAYFTGGFRNIDLWFRVIPKLNLGLFILFSGLFGLLFALQVYDWREGTCDVKNKTASSASGGLGALTALVIPACPACVSLATFILPAAGATGFSNFVVQYGAYLLAGSILLLILGLFLLGGFKEERV